MIVNGARAGEEYILKYEDQVRLCGMKYYVKSNYLEHEGGNKYNEEIFSIVGIQDKYSFASIFYGYDTTSGKWPSARYNDFEALTRLARALELAYECKPKIEITVKVNGKETKLSDISEETLLKIRSAY